MKIKNIIITGDPRSGKSTLISKIISSELYKVGFVTNEILNNGTRLGFEINTSNGLKTILAHVNGSSSLKVSRYQVFPENLDRIIELMPPIDSKDLLYIDEIGQMELFSKRFKAFTQSYLDSSNVCITTLSKIYSDEFIEAIKSRQDCVFFNLTSENRLEQERLIKKKLLELR